MRVGTPRPRPPARRRAAARLPSRGPWSFGLYPIEGDDFPDLRDVSDRLRLNDAALVYEPESSTALGFGFRCGFLGLLHMDIVRERLEREFDLALITTAPNVAYRVTLETGETIMVSNPQRELPPAGSVQRIEEPYGRHGQFADYIGPVMELRGRRGELGTMEYLSEERRAALPAPWPRSSDFDQLKSRDPRVRLADYEPSGYREADLVKVDVLLQGEPVDAFSAIVHKDKAYAYGQAMTAKLAGRSPPALRGADPGHHRGQGDRAGDHHRPAQGRAGQVAGGDVTPQAQAAGAPEGGQAADEADRPGRGAAGGVRGRPADRRELIMMTAVTPPTTPPVEAPLVDPGSFGVYVHVPFCPTRCHYCDFVTYTGMEGLRRPAAAALLEAPWRRPPSARPRRRSPVFVGGGTPTLLPPGDLARLLERLAELLPLAPGAEVTVEANPETVDAAMADGLAGAGVTRCRWAPRASTTGSRPRSAGSTTPPGSGGVATLRAAGVPAVNLDLIYGGPGEDAASWSATLAAAVARSSPSTCPPTPSPSSPATKFGRLVAAGQLAEPGEDDLADRYDTTCATLAAAGYRHYEVSNWARTAGTRTPCTARLPGLAPRGGAQRTRA